MFDPVKTIVDDTLRQESRRNKLIADIEKAVEPYLYKDSRLNTFIQLQIPIENTKMTKGLLLGSKDERVHQIVYPRSVGTDEGNPVEKYINADIRYLSIRQLQSLKNVLQYRINHNTVVPVTMKCDFVEDYPFEVTFGRPFDEQFRDVAENYGVLYTADNRCETWKFDEAVDYADQMTTALLSRGDVCHRHPDGKAPESWSVTIETDDDRLLELAAKNEGQARKSTFGTPLVIAEFGTQAAAAAYRDEARQLLGMKPVEKTDDAEHLQRERHISDIEGILMKDLPKWVDSVLFRFTPVGEGKEQSYVLNMDNSGERRHTLTYPRPSGKEGLVENRVVYLSDMDSRTLNALLGKIVYAVDNRDALETPVEQYRQQLSAILMDTDEQHPLKCDVLIGEAEAMGLSSLELPHVVSAYQLPSEGIMYFNIEGADEPLEFDDLWQEDMSVILGYYNDTVKRFTEAVDAVRERTASQSAKAFTPEQRATIELAGHLGKSGGGVAAVYEQLHKEATKDLDVPDKWKQDSLEELEDLAKGKTRSQGRGKGIS